MGWGIWKKIKQGISKAINWIGDKAKKIKPVIDKGIEIAKDVLPVLDKNGIDTSKIKPIVNKVDKIVNNNKPAVNFGGKAWTPSFLK